MNRVAWLHDTQDPTPQSHSLMGDPAPRMPLVPSDDTLGKKCLADIAQDGDDTDFMDDPTTSAADVVGPLSSTIGHSNPQNEMLETRASTLAEPTDITEEDAAKELSDDLPGSGSPSCSFNEDSESDHEREAQIASELMTGIQMRSGPARLKLQRETGRKRGLQASQFLMAIENRVRELESEVKRLQTAQEERHNETEVVLDAEGGVASKETSAGFLIKPARLSWADFSLSSHLRVLRNQAIIDILIETPHSFGQKTNVFGVFDGKPRLLPGSQSHARRRQQSGLKQARFPVERIRFNSLHLQQVFEDILGSDIPLHSPGITQQLRPFKAIVPYTNELSAKLSELEQLIEKKDKMMANSADGNKAFHLSHDGEHVSETTPDERDSKRDKNNVEQSQLDIPRHDLVTMRDHTKALVECFETALLAEVTSYTQLRSRLVVDQSVKIDFTDLWYLFAPGDLIYDHTSEQAFRVLSVSGGSTYLVDEVSMPPPQPYETVQDPVTGQFVAVHAARPRRLKATDMLSDFVLTCFHLSFDGVRFGPVQKDIIIEPFEGSTSVDSLAVVPIEYAKNTKPRARSGQVANNDTEQSLQEALLARGRLFADLAHPGEAGMWLLRQHQDCHALTATSFVWCSPS
jgi:hypothetical protein